ncbi:hypothetical protein L2E82_37783 [Cichorium intybus]|uniref:Uncharacterized protein n=1 Tax=Cichorium intybus TaxID=13427 RepID=A0ACB9AGR4_CICIN|nr:hypothetical protein L2E82_37783 [Cichorium intybus]
MSNYTCSLGYTVDLCPHTNLTVRRPSPTHVHLSYRTPPRTRTPFSSRSTHSRHSAAMKDFTPSLSTFNF